MYFGKQILHGQRPSGRYKMSTVEPNVEVVNTGTFMSGTITTSSNTLTASDNLMGWSSNSNIYYPTTTTTPYINSGGSITTTDTPNYNYYHVLGTYSTIFSQLESLLASFTPEQHGFTKEEWNLLKFTWDGVHCTCKKGEEGICLGCTSLKYMVFVLGKSRVITLVEQLATSMKDIPADKQPSLRRIRIPE
jgi:hypothetical protein